LPYFYTLFFNASVSGVPVLRPLWIQFPDEENVFEIDDSFMVGSDLLVMPVTDQGAEAVVVYLPGKGKNSWFDTKNYNQYVGGQYYSIPTPLSKIPVFQRSGSIVVRQERKRRSSALMKNDPYTLRIALGESQYAVGTLYLDDGHSFDFQNGGYCHRTFEMSENLLSSYQIDGCEKFSVHNVIERIIILGLQKEVKSVTFGDNNYQFSMQDSVLVIRKPNLKIVGDFTIQIK